MSLGMAVPIVVEKIVMQTATAAWMGPADLWEREILEYNIGDSRIVN